MQKLTNDDNYIDIDDTELGGPRRRGKGRRERCIPSSRCRQSKVSKHLPPSAVSCWDKKMTWRRERVWVSGTQEDWHTNKGETDQRTQERTKCNEDKIDEMTLPVGWLTALVFCPVRRTNTHTYTCYFSVCVFLFQIPSALRWVPLFLLA